MKELSIDAKTENLEAVLDFVTGELEAADCPLKLQTQIAIVVEEIFVNIAQYAYEQDAWASSQDASASGTQSIRPASATAERPAPGIGGVVIKIALGDEVIIEFEDQGKHYNPLEKDDPDITVKIEEREIGGLGIFMMKKIMDTVEYRYEDNKNILIIKKTF